MSDCNTTSGRGLLRVLIPAIAAVLLVAVAAVPAAADEEESTESAVLVEQAIALIANQGGDERIAERIADALDAPDKEGVDLAKVSQAQAIIDAPGEDPAATQQARALLLASIGDKLPSAVPHGQEATGIETGTNVILDEFRPAAGITNRGDAALLALSLAAITVGVYLSWRLRPRHSVHQLSSTAAGSPKEQR